MEGIPGYRVASTGTQPGARIVVTGRLIRWAVIMEKSHLQKIQDRFLEEVEGKRVIALHGAMFTGETLAETRLTLGRTTTAFEQRLHSKANPHYNYETPAWIDRRARIIVFFHLWCKTGRQSAKETIG